MDNIIDNRHILYQIIKYLPFNDLIKMRRINSGYKNYVDNNFNNRFNIIKLEPIKEPILMTELEINAEYEEFVGQIKKHLHEMDIISTIYKKSRLKMVYIIYNYIIQNIYILKHPKMLKFNFTLIYKIISFYNGGYNLIKPLNTMFNKFNYHLMNIVFKDNRTYDMYHLYERCSIKKYLQIDDIINLRCITKLLHISTIFNADLIYIHNININKPLMKTRNGNKINLYNDDLKIVIDIINNNFIYCKNRFTICNKFANSLNVLIKYIYYIDVNIIKKINNYIDIIVKHDFIATQKLTQVIKAYNEYKSLISSV